MAGSLEDLFNQALKLSENKEENVFSQYRIFILKALEDLDQRIKCILESLSHISDRVNTSENKSESHAKDIKDIENELKHIDETINNISSKLDKNVSNIENRINKIESNARLNAFKITLLISAFSSLVAFAVWYLKELVQKVN